MFDDLRESLRLSIEACIRDHLDQDTNRESAIREAAKEIVDIVCRPIAPDQGQKP